MVVKENTSLKSFNTFGINVLAKYFANFNSVNELHELLDFNQPQTNNHKPQTLILGGGSNILFTKDVDGLVLKNEIVGIKEIKEDEHHVYVQAGQELTSFCLHCIHNGWAGGKPFADTPVMWVLHPCRI